MLFYLYLGYYFRQLPANRVTISWQDVARLSDLTEPEKAVLDSLRRYGHAFSRSGSVDQTVGAKNAKIATGSDDCLRYSLAG